MPEGAKGLLYCILTISMLEVAPFQHYNHSHARGGKGAPFQHFNHFHAVGGKGAPLLHFNHFRDGGGSFPAFKQFKVAEGAKRLLSRILTIPMLEGGEAPTHCPLLVSPTKHTAPDDWAQGYDLILLVPGQ